MHSRVTFASINVCVFSILLMLISSWVHEAHCKLKRDHVCFDTMTFASINVYVFSMLLMVITSWVHESHCNLQGDHVCFYTSSDVVLRLEVYE